MMSMDSASSYESNSAPQTVLRSAVAFQKELQDENPPATPPLQASLPATPEEDTGSPRSVRVQFNEIVSGMEIPSRHQYSSRIKKTIWSNRDEMHAMVMRNVQEFEAEGFDWKNVVMDQDMYVNEANGELIHPCHYRFGASYSSLVDEQDSKEDPFSFTPLRRRNSLG